MAVGIHQRPRHAVVAMTETEQCDGELGQGNWAQVSSGKVRKSHRPSPDPTIPGADAMKTR